MQQNSESTYQGGESMQKIKAKENMQDPESCRGCVMPLLPCFCDSYRLNLKLFKAIFKKHRQQQHEANISGSRTNRK